VTPIRIPRTVRLVLVSAAVLAIALIFIVGRVTGGGAATGTRISNPGTARETARSATPPAAGQRQNPASPTAGGRPSDPGDVDDGAGVQPTGTPPITAGERDVVTAAEKFVASWLNTTDKTPLQWVDSLVDRCTPAEADLLKDADLATIPVGVIRSGGIVSTAGAIVDVAVQLGNSDPDPTRRKPVGTVTLTMDGSTGTWLVNGIDWAAAS
jgi:hypothetical protein